MQLKIKISRRLVRKKRVYCVDWHEPGKPRRRLYFKTEAAANAQVESLRMQHRNVGDDFFVLSDAERYELISVWHEVKAAGLTMRYAWERARVGSGSGPTIIEVINEMTTAKLKAGRSRNYVEELRKFLVGFVNAIPCHHIGEIGLPEVEKFLDLKTPASRSTVRARLSTLFKFAIRRGYRIDNPCARLEPIKVTRQPPAIFTVEQVRKCLNWFRKHPRCWPWFVLSTFCGLRPEEAEKTTRTDINLDDGWIRVEAQTTKIRQRRVVYPKPEALALLKVALRKGKTPIPWQPRRRALRSLRKLLGFDRWPKDITRHTAASYWLADCESAASVAKSLGNSESVLMKHYAALVTREQARVFWAIRA